MKQFLPDMAGHCTIQLTVVVTACIRPRQDQVSQNPSRDGGPDKVPCLQRTMRGFFIFRDVPRDSVLRLQGVALCTYGQQ